MQVSFLFYLFVKWNILFPVLFLIDRVVKPFDLLVHGVIFVAIVALDMFSHTGCICMECTFGVWC